MLRYHFCSVGVSNEVVTEYIRIHSVKNVNEEYTHTKDILYTITCPYQSVALLC